MKWYNSLIIKITLIFALALVGMGAILYIIHTQTKKFELHNTQRFARAVLRENPNLHSLKNAGFKEIKKEILKKEILKHIRFQPKRMKSQKHIRVKAITYNMKIYIIVSKGRIFQAPHEAKIFPKIIFPIVTILLILFLYIAIIKSILPLYKLRKSVKEFANGNYDIDCTSDKKDEIAILSNEFDRSVKKIKKLRDSRQLFLRNIMHELKTPITKGKLSCEMIEESNYQKILKNVFRRQETLLNEFARIEKLSANELNINTRKYSLQDVVDFSLDILNHEKHNITCKLSPINLHVDFELFGTALKNLLDNGINYSDDKHVLLESNENQIIISSNGKELEFPLQNYAQPYFLDSKKAQSSQGLGFGLFITLHVIRLHKMKIEYNRQNNKNEFVINVKKN